MKLEVIRLKKEYKDCIAIKDLSFSLETGEIAGFIGPNGSGKTTTMKMITNIETCTDGDIRIDGISILEHPELIRNHIGYVPDSIPSIKDMTVHEYLDFFTSAYGFKTPERQRIVKDLEEFTNLATIKWKTINTLSKGMKQRISIARALINDPDFVLMDEPAAGLDPKARLELKNMLLFLKKQGKGILISSHILSELSEMCTSTIIIEKGVLLKSGKIDNVVHEVEKTHNPVFQIKTLDTPNEKVIKIISLNPMVDKITVNGNTIEFEYSGSEKQVGELVKKLLSEGIHLLSFGFKKEDLESAFMRITKGEIQ